MVAPAPFNGYPVATKTIIADGAVQPLTFDLDIHHSSWIAVRILPSVHTNPVWVEVEGAEQTRHDRRPPPSAARPARGASLSWNDVGLPPVGRR